MSRIASFLLACLIALAAAPSAGAANDDGAHPNERVEWWRCYARVHASDGRTFDVTFLAFRFALAAARTAVGERNRWDGGTSFAATLGVVDETRDRLVRGERRERDAVGIASAATTRLSLRVADWSLVRSRATTTLRANAEGLDLALTATPRRAALRFADGEVVETSLRVRGRVRVDGRTRPVVGTAWLDHTFGARARRRDVVGWERFCIQLDDGRELFFEIVRLRGETFGRVTHRTLVDARGRRREFPASQRAPREGARAGWRSLRTGARYPDVFGLVIASEDLAISLEPVRYDQEFAGASGVPFWSGAVDVFDVRPWSMGARLGTGFVELTGYASPVDL